MDYADDDAVRGFQRWEKALNKLAAEFSTDDELSRTKQFATRLIGDSSISILKREAIINAARIPGEAHLVRLGKAFPEWDVPALIHALRVKVVELRLLEGL